MNSNEFAKRVSEILESKGVSTDFSPSVLIQVWREFVDGCMIGYSWGLYEYRNDLAVRFWIEEILESKDLVGNNEYKEFAKRISEIDESFQNLLHVEYKLEGSFWWESGVLKYAGKDLAEDLKREYCITINVKEPK